MRNLPLVLAVTVSLFAAASARAQNLIINGNFATGDLTGWSNNSYSLYGGSGNTFLVQPNNGSPLPISGSPTQIDPGGSSYFAVSDQIGPGVETLTQSFTMAAGATDVSLSFDWFNASYAAQFGNTLDASDQVATVDILTGSASPYDTGSGVVENLLLNEDAGNTTWQTSTFDLGSLAGGIYQLRFGTSDCCFFQELGVANVVLTETVPEPISLSLFGGGLFGLALARRRHG